MYAQPLVVANGDGSMNVYVATMQDNLYVFTVPKTWNPTAGCSQVQSREISLLSNGQHPADACFVGNGTNLPSCHEVGQERAICPSVGVLGTPTVDTASNTLYLVTESQDIDTPPEGENCGTKSKPTTWYHYLHALDLTTLAEKNSGPVLIKPAHTGPQFESKQLLQRPGLLFLPPRPPFTPIEATVYAAFSMMDGTRPNPSGWVVAYNGGNLLMGGTPLVFATVQNFDTKGRFGGGIWQGGAGLAAGLDANQNNFLYFSTGDGVFDANNSGPDYGDSFVKLTTDLQPADYFAPADAFYRWDSSCHGTEGWDFDFGSAGVLAVPPDTHMNSAYQSVAVKADKENYLWVMDRTHPGQSNACGTCSCQMADGNIQKLAVSTNHTGEPQSRSTPAFWDDGTTPFLYFAPAAMPLSKYPLTGAPPNGPIGSPTASSPSDPPDNMGYAATPSISSNGNHNNGTGIVWAFIATKSDLEAFDAETLARLYRSTDCARDVIGTPAKFSVPTVANGYVFVGTQTDFDIFGTTSAACN